MNINYDDLKNVENKHLLDLFGNCEIKVYNAQGKKFDEYWDKRTKLFEELMRRLENKQ